MVGKKQRFKTVVLIIFLAVVIVGGVFAVSYFKGGVTFPWQVVTSEQEAEPVAEEPAKEEPKLVVKEKPKAEEKKEEPKEEPKKVEEKEEPSEESDAGIAKVDNQLDYFGALHVEDGKLVNKDGDEVQLLGVSTHGLSWYPDFAKPDTITSLKTNWGINVIRLALYTSDYNGYCVSSESNQADLKKLIDDAVQAATENEMYVILDWHTLNDADPNEYKADAIQFFGEMVRKYESNENVIYEICNEPNGDTTWDDIRKYANEVIPVIRNVNKDAVILVGTPKWSSDLDSVLENPLEFDNIMYTYHFYAGSHKSSQRNGLTNALEDGLPVFISEYGYVSADGNGNVDKHEATRWNDIIDDYGLSACIWNLSNKDEGSALISSECDKTFDFAYEDLSAQGQYFFDRINNLDRRNSSNDN